ncbi:MAG TPA: transporter [Burkholderiales bacterium]|jgi:hypothetical protein|nr:transporter [Burkholderiales bacterium]
MKTTIALASAGAVLLSGGAQASCGSAFCTLNTNWDVQGAWTEPGLKLDLRYEYIRQDQPQTGTRQVPVGEIPRHHDEVSTANRNWIAALDYTLSPDWALNAQVPIADREHLHIHNHGGAQVPESWSFTRMGDARITARRRVLTLEDAAAQTLGTGGVTFGLKLPTGQTDVRNGEGELAERTLQPGTGTTDLLAGAYYSHLLPAKNLSWFVQGLVQLPLNSHADYRPGQRLSLDAGARYQASEQVSAMLQLNALFRGRDAGNQAEPEDTGGRSLFLSPGFGYTFSKDVQLYGFLQLPLYQSVNGVQLTAKRAVVLGLSTRF